MGHAIEGEHGAELRSSALRDRIAELERECLRLRDEEQRYRLFTEAADEGLWAIDAEARTVYANAKMARMLGVRVEDLIGAPLFDFIDQRDGERCRAILERRRQGLSDQLDLELVRRDGERILARLRRAPIMAADNVYSGSVALVADITAQRRAEQELRRQKDDFRLIFDSAPAMIWFKDTQNRILRVNSLAAAASGLAVSEIEGCSTYDLFPAQAAAYHKDDLEVIRSNRPKLGIIEPIVLATGETRWIHTDKIPCRDERGQAIGVVVFALDITEAKRAQDARAESEKRYRDLVETSHDLICSFDLEGRWTFVNSIAARRIFGREPEELLGRPFTELVAPERMPEDPQAFGRVLAGESLNDYETVHVRGDSTRVYLSINAIPVRDERGVVVGVTCTGKDITERKRAEAERELINAKLLQTQKLESLGVLAGGIAHDFNNLLVGILGNAELALMDLPSGAPARSAVEGVRDAALCAADLARQMLGYSGRGKFVVERIDLSRLVAEMAHLLSAVISKKAELRIETREGLPAVEGDATQIRQVIMNLITNASDAMGDRSGTILVSTGVVQADAELLASAYVQDQLEPGTHVWVEVTDTGCGMDARTLARIFEPFYTTKFTGRGLGLSAVLGVLRSHKGAIRVRSEPNRGTTVTLFLPAVAAPAESAERAPVAGADRGRAWKGTGTVLVVDDEEIVRAVTRTVLERAGFGVIEAQDGRAALETFRQHRAGIVAVLLDMTMPHLSGEETFRELRQIDPLVRVILTSGYSEQDATGRFAGRGLAGFIRKPCTPEEMLASLRSALEP